MTKYPYKQEIIINSTDITNDVISYKIKKTDKPVKSAEIIIKSTTSLTINKTIIGKSITIKRTFPRSSPTLVEIPRIIFNGEIIKEKKDGSVYELTCACKMNATNRLEADYVYDKDIDIEGGVGSEIVKSLYNKAGLNYTSTSVPSTGTDPEYLLKTYKANGSILKNLYTLGTIYNRIFYYDDQDDLAYFIEPMSRTTSTILETGVNIVGRVVWSDTGEDIINNVSVVGGKQIDWATEEFTGPITEATLTASPLDTEIYTGTTRLERGVNTTSPNDYYVDSSNKKIIFTSSQSNLSIRYSYSIPIKVQYNDTDSMTNYYQVDRTILDTNITNTDDAELLAQGHVEEFKEPLVSAPIRVIYDNNIRVGDKVQIKDNINTITIDVDVQGITYNYPYRPDEVTIGKLPIDDLDYERKIIDRITELEKQASDTGDINILLKNITDIELGTGAYLLLEKATMEADVLYWDSDTQSDWDDFDWGDDDVETLTEVYKETGYD